MSKFIIKEDFWELCPEAEISVILAKGLDNSDEGNEKNRDDIESELKEANKAAKKFLTAEVFSDNKVISVWRDVFRRFKTKKGARCSIEAMLKRIDKGNEIGMINPLVDVYNTVSLNNAIPCGGEDLDSLSGDMVLTVAEGGESFLPLGADKNEDALPGEIIYKDNIGAVCRCWNWREGERTILTENTKNAFLIIEAIDPDRHDDFVKATNELNESVQKYFGCPTTVHFLNKDNREIEIK